MAANVTESENILFVALKSIRYTPESFLMYVPCAAEVKQLVCASAERRERPRGDQEGDGAAAGGLSQTGSRHSGGGETDPGGMFFLQLHNKDYMLVFFL